MQALEQGTRPAGLGVSRRTGEGETRQPSTQPQRGPSRRAVTAGIIGIAGLAVAGGATWEVLSGK